MNKQDEEKTMNEENYTFKNEQGQAITINSYTHEKNEETFSFVSNKLQGLKRIDDELGEELKKLPLNSNKINYLMDRKEAREGDLNQTLLLQNISTLQANLSALKPDDFNRAKNTIQNLVDQLVFTCLEKAA